MCKEYINLQTNEVLDMEIVEGLKDNAMLKVKPELWIEWDFKKNDEFDVYAITYGSGNKIWWIGKECGHEWESTVAHRTNGRNCPYCNKNNPRTLRGFNDLWTTDSCIANRLNNPEEGYLYSRKSDKKLDWKCPDCNFIITRAVKDATKRGVKCSNCADGMSYGEKVIYNLLRDNNVIFTYDKTMYFSENKRYDFYLPEHSLIIEVHGGQHSKQATGHFGENRSLQDEIKNDTFKREVALSNGITNYVEIHITDEDTATIPKEIEKSQLLNIINLKDINWNNVLLKSQKSLVLEVCEEFENDINTTTDELVNKFKLTRSTVIKYLKIGNVIGICNYVPNARPSNYRGEKVPNSRKVVQLALTGEYLNEYSTITEAFMITKCNNISAVCRGVLNYAGGFKWMYKEDYDELVKSK